jgi:uncharacterized phage-associated protein
MDRMTTSARAVAEEFKRRLPGIGDLKLQKLLYYAQGHHLATFDAPLFSDAISAWDKGPVVPSVWHDGRSYPDSSGEFADALSEAELNTIGYVLSRYGGMSGQDLIRLSHSEEPWLQANAGRRPGTGVRIDNQAIRSYFLQAMEDEDESGPPVDAEILAAWLSGATERADRPASPDSLEELDARRAELAAG